MRTQLHQITRTQGKKVTASRIKELKQAGASHLAGSFLWEETYRIMPEARRKKLRRIALLSDNGWIDEDNQTYLLPLKNLSTKF